MRTKEIFFFRARAFARWQDPLEAIMWMTSVGTPSVIYDTVKWLRQARGARLGAMQRKLPLATPASLEKT